MSLKGDTNNTLFNVLLVQFDCRDICRSLGSFDVNYDLSVVQ